MAVHVGIDFGSLGWRLRYVQNDQIAALPAEGLRPPPGGWLVCSPSRSNGIGMAYPSLKNSLGVEHAVPVNGGVSSPSELVRDQFAQARQALQGRGVGDVQDLVIAVPARYSASRRAYLREAAQLAGFGEVHLINDSMAAVVAHHAGSAAPATFLVISSGYLGFEIALVRAARGRYRALGYEGGQQFGGFSTDELILRSWLAALGERSLLLNTQQWSNAQWLQLQKATDAVKRHLSEHDESVFPLDVRTPENQPIRVRFSRSSLEEKLTPCVQSALDCAVRLLAAARVAADDLDTVLLVGGSTRIPCVHGLVQRRLGKEPTFPPDDILAKGAALYAVRLGDAQAPLPALGDGDEPADDATELPATESTMRSTLLIAEEPEPAQVPSEEGESLGQFVIVAAPPTSGSQAPNVDSLLDYPRQLLAQGQPDGARSLLETLIEKSRELLETIPQAAAATDAQEPHITSGARLALTQANRLLREGKQEEAVRLSHLAWQNDRDNPQVFDQMIEIHQRAAGAANEVEGYEDAIRWLMCAYGHDQTNAAIREEIADRHFSQAKALAERRREGEAKSALSECLRLNPDHAEGLALQRSFPRK